MQAKKGDKIQTENGIGEIIDFEPTGPWVHIKPKDMIIPGQPVYYLTDKQGQREEKQMTGLVKLFAFEEVRGLSTDEMVEAL